MSRRMIDEGALDAQIKEATTTKQDKLTPKIDGSITIQKIDTTTYIGSKVMLFKTFATANFPVEAKTYEVGDYIRCSDTLGGQGAFLALTDNYITTYKFNDGSGIVALLVAYADSSYPTLYTNARLIILKGGTVAKAFTQQCDMKFVCIKNVDNYR